MKKPIIGIIAVFAILFVGSKMLHSTPSAEAAILAQNGNFTYETFTQERFDALKGNEEFSVFVHSKACGTCAKKNKEIIEDVQTFTKGAILKLEYDEAPQEFLREYGVTKYDTFINFNADGSSSTVKGASVGQVRNSLSSRPTPSVVEQVVQAIVPTVYAQSDVFTYQDYDQASYEALRGNEAFALFFHSKACGTCAKKNQEIIDEVAEFTGGKILKIEYSEADQALLAEFGVTKYDTFVVFAADGSFETLKGGLVDDVRSSL